MAPQIDRQKPKQEKARKRRAQRTQRQPLNPSSVVSVSSCSKSIERVEITRTLNPTAACLTRRLSIVMRAIAKSQQRTNLGTKCAKIRRGDLRTAKHPFFPLPHAPSPPPKNLTPCVPFREVSNVEATEVGGQLPGPPCPLLRGPCLRITCPLRRNLSSSGKYAHSNQKTCPLPRIKHFQHPTSNLPSRLFPLHPAQPEPPANLAPES